MSKNKPTNLLEAIRYFADVDVATDFVAKLRWPEGPVCPRCGSHEYSYLTTRRVWKCKGCKKQYSVKLGTIFEDSPLGLDKWLPAIWLIANSKNGISSHELGRSLGVTQKSAWFMLHRIRLAMQQGSIEKMGGEIEVDETYIGGLARNMHAVDRKRKVTGRGRMLNNKTAVFGARNRDGEVRAAVVPDTKGTTLKPRISEWVEQGSTVYSDTHGGYYGLGRDYDHRTADHAEQHVNGKSIPTASRTSGACSNAAYTAPTSASNRFTCSATSTSGSLRTTVATLTTPLGLSACSTPSPADG
jgi:transposase-like protein